MAHFQKILVPCDGSPPSIAALTEALALASDVGAKVDVLVVDEPASGHTPAASAGDNEQKVLEEALVAAKRMLGARVKRRVESGDPATTIVAAAADYDLVVMGTHGRLGRLRATLGSVAETVVRSASCPVLTVRTPTGQEESFAERIHRAKSIAEQARR
jgi:nucleotide-binding universal stress UspA family protein